MEVDLERVSGSNACFDFAIEFTGASEHSDIVQLRYGLQNKDSIDIVPAPSLTETPGTDCIGDGDYQADLASTQPPYKGTAVLTYDNGNITFSFTN